MGSGLLLPDEQAAVTATQRPSAVATILIVTLLGRTDSWVPQYRGQTSRLRLSGTVQERAGGGDGRARDARPRALFRSGNDSRFGRGRQRGRVSVSGENGGRKRTLAVAILRAPRAESHRASSADSSARRSRRLADARHANDDV